MSRNLKSGLKLIVMSTRVLLYQGSFDPPHEGHYDCLVQALELTQAKKCVILPNENNAWKPAMQTLETRIEMLKILFKGLPNVEIAEESKQEARKKWLAQAHVIFLIGSDAWPRFAAKEEIPYPEICIVCRNDGEKPKLGEWEGKKIYLLEQEKKGLSSTKVRELLNGHPEWYHQGLAGGQTLPLPPLLREFIFNKALYCQKEIEMRSHLEKSLLEKGYATFPNQTLTLKCLNEVQQAGLSGNLCYVLSHEQTPLAFIKVYSRENGKRYFASELAALKLMEKLGLKTVERIYWAENCQLAVSFISEPDFSKVWQQNGKDLVKTSFSIGQALKKLHEASRRQSSADETNAWIEKTKDNLRLDTDKLKTYFSTLKGASSVCTYAHLDPNLGNFIEKDGTILLIDLEKMGSSIGESGEPVGHPEYDYYQFLKNLHIQQFFYPLDLFNEIEKSFKEGYGSTAGLFSPEVEAFCRAYCLVKEALFYFQQGNRDKGEKRLAEI